MVEPEHLVLEHPPAIRGEMAKLANWMGTVSTEMAAMRRHHFGAIATLNHAELKVRRDRIVRRLELVD